MSLVVRENFGWLPDIPDVRDIPLRITPGMIAGTPPRVDLRDHYQWKVFDQGNLGSCVGNAVAAAIEYAQGTRVNDPNVSDFLEKDRVFVPSRLFIYRGAREIIGLVDEDSGCHIRDAMKVVYNIGAPRETGWKYIEKNFAKLPPKKTYQSAPFHKITSYRAVPVNVDAIKVALSEGLPVIFGIAVYNSFFHDRAGNIQFPRAGDYMVGGHAMLLVGYDDATGRFIFLNSWGEQWGTGGYGTIPYEYVGHPGLGADYWVLTDDQYKERM